MIIYHFTSQGMCREHCAGLHGPPCYGHDDAGSMLHKYLLVWWLHALRAKTFASAHSFAFFKRPLLPGGASELHVSRLEARGSWTRVLRSVWSWLDSYSGIHCRWTLVVMVPILVLGINWLLSFEFWRSFTRLVSMALREQRSTQRTERSRTTWNQGYLSLI